MKNVVLDEVKRELNEICKLLKYNEEKTKNRIQEFNAIFNATQRKSYKKRSENIKSIKNAML